MNQPFVNSPEASDSLAYFDSLVESGEILPVIVFDSDYWTVAIVVSDEKTKITASDTNLRSAIIRVMSGYCAM